MSPSTTSVILFSALVLPVYTAEFTDCSRSSYENVVKENLSSPCHAGSKGPQKFNLTGFTSNTEENLRRLKAVRIATEEYQFILMERLNGKGVLPERCLPISIQNKDERLRKAVRKIRKREKGVKDGLMFMQKLLRSYVTSVEMLIQGKECLLKHQKVNVKKHTQDKSGYINIQQNLLHTLCLYQQFGVDSDTKGIDTLVTWKSCLDLNELDLEGHRLTEDIIKSVNIAITKLTKTKSSNRRSLNRHRNRTKKRGQTRRRRKDRRGKNSKRRKSRRKENSNKRQKDVVIDVGKRLPQRRKMVDPNKT